MLTPLPPLPTETPCSLFTAHWYNEGLSPLGSREVGGGARGATQMQPVHREVSEEESKMLEDKRWGKCLFPTFFSPAVCFTDTAQLL